MINKVKKTDWFKIDGEQLVDILNLVTVYEQILTIDELDEKTIHSILFEDVRDDDNFSISKKKLEEIVDKQRDRFIKIKCSMLQQLLDFGINTNEEVLNNSNQPHKIKTPQTVEEEKVEKYSEYEILQFEDEHSQNSSEIDELERDIENGNIDSTINDRIETLKEINEMLELKLYPNSI